LYKGEHADVLLFGAHHSGIYHYGLHVPVIACLLRDPGGLAPLALFGVKAR
jgi:hypothetical protein